MIGGAMGAISGPLIGQQSGGGPAMSACVIFAIAAVAFVFWLWTLVEVIRQPAYDRSQRTKWLIVVTVLPIIGPLLHAMLGVKTETGP